MGIFDKYLGNVDENVEMIKGNDDCFQKAKAYQAKGVSKRKKKQIIRFIVSVPINKKKNN